MVLKAIAVHVIDRNIPLILSNDGGFGRLDRVCSDPAGLNNTSCKVGLARTEVTKEADNIPGSYSFCKLPGDLLRLLYTMADLFSHHGRGFNTATGRITSSMAAPPC